MQKTKLFQLLFTLDVYQFNRFRKFLRSPYFNEDENLMRLFEILSPHFKKETTDLLKQQKIWKAIYGSQKFSPLKFARLFSDLLKKLEEFLVVDELKQNNSRKQRNLLNYLTENNLNKHYPESSKLARKHLQKSPYRDGDFYLQLFKLEAAENTFIESKNQRTTEKNLLQTMEALDTFYIINKLNYLAAILHYKNFLSLEGEVGLVNEILTYLQSNKSSEVPAISIYHKICLTMIEPDNELHFKQLKTLLEKNHSLFPKQTARNQYAFAINYAIRKINFGRLEYIKELLSIYRQMLKADLMTDNSGSLSQFDYKNIVTVGLRANEEKWTANFIREYKKRIPKQNQKNAYTFNLAKLYFYQKKYGKVLPLLQNVEYTDVFYQLDSKTTLMKSYYELGECLPLMSLKESFRIMLRRKKIISEQNRTNYMNFIRFTMKLYRADVRDKQKISALAKSITTSTNVADKGWLMEKVKELTA